jgi:hypothetical protein
MSALAVIIAVAFALATSVFSYVAAMSAASPTCAGRDLLQGYRSGALDFFAWPLFSVLFVTAIVVARRSPRTNEFLASFDVVVLEFASFRLTYGTFLVYSSLFGFAALDGLMTMESAARFRAISSYCHPAAAVG